MLFKQSEWCCDSLHVAFERRAERGIYIYAELPHDQISVGASFWMGMRSIDVGSELPTFTPSENPSPICVETWYRIKHCPWCGCNLERFYRKTYRRLYDADIAKRHNWNPPN